MGSWKRSLNCYCGQKASAAPRTWAQTQRKGRRNVAVHPSCGPCTSWDLSGPGLGWCSAPPPGFVSSLSPGASWRCSRSPCSWWWSRPPNTVQEQACHKSMCLVKGYSSKAWCGRHEDEEKVVEHMEQIRSRCFFSKSIGHGKVVFMQAKAEGNTLPRPQTTVARPSCHDESPQGIWQKSLCWLGRWEYIHPWSDWWCSTHCPARGERQEWQNWTN